MLTQEQLHAVMPQLSAAKATTLLPFLTAAVAEFGIEQPARTAAFLAQLAHESGQFRFMEEIWGPTAAQRRYEPPGKLAATLGNTETGDGLRFKGRGPIQITGRANYRRFGDLLRIDLLADPACAARPDVAFRIAGLFWSKKGLNELADLVTPEAFREITRRINGGFNGLQDRERFYEAAKGALGVAGPVIGGPRTTVDLEEPTFERGHEAIRSHAARRTGRRTGAKKTTVRKRSRKARSVRTPAKRTKARTTPARAKARKRASKKATGRRRVSR